jgi:hypothetical protein
MAVDGKQNVATVLTDAIAEDSGLTWESATFAKAEGGIGPTLILAPI